MGGAVGCSAVSTIRSLNRLLALIAQVARSCPSCPQPSVADGAATSLVKVLTISRVALLPGLPLRTENRTIRFFVLSASSSEHGAAGLSG